MYAVMQCGVCKKVYAVKSDVMVPARLWPKMCSRCAGRVGLEVTGPLQANRGGNNKVSGNGRIIRLPVRSAA